MHNILIRSNYRSTNIETLICIIWTLLESRIYHMICEHSCTRVVIIYIWSSNCYWYIMAFPFKHNKHKWFMNIYSGIFSARVDQNSLTQRITCPSTQKWWVLYYYFKHRWNVRWNVCAIIILANMAISCVQSLSIGVINKWIFHIYFPALTSSSLFCCWRVWRHRANKASENLRQLRIFFTFNDISSWTGDRG